MTTWGGYGGYWWTANVMLEVPAYSTYNGQFFVLMQKYGGYVAWSHAQLSIVGYSDRWLWQEAALGSGGEAICFDPLGSHTRSLITDVRVVLFDQSWKGNVGGGEVLIYFNETGALQVRALPKVESAAVGPHCAERSRDAAGHLARPSPLVRDLTPPPSPPSPPPPRFSISKISTP